MLATSIVVIVSSAWMYLCFSLIHGTFFWSLSQLLFSIPSMVIVIVTLSGFVYASQVELK